MRLGRAGFVLIHEFKQSREWKAYSEGTKAEWTRLLAKVEDAWGPLMVRKFEPMRVLRLRDQHAETPAQTNNMLRALSLMLTWAMPRGWCPYNAAISIKKLKGGEADAKQMAETDGEAASA